MGSRIFESSIMIQLNDAELQQELLITESKKRRNHGQ